MAFLSYPFALSSFSLLAFSGPKRNQTKKTTQSGSPFIDGGKNSSSFLNVVLEEHVVRYTFVRVRCNLGTFVYYSAFCTYIPNRSNTHWRQRVNFPFPWYSKQEKLSPAFRLHSAVYLEIEKNIIFFTFYRTVILQGNANAYIVHWKINVLHYRPWNLYYL